MLLRKDSDPEKPRVLLLSPTGVAAVNIGGTTIHSALGIHAKVFAPLNDKMRASLRNRLSEVALIIIDEISMVSNRLFKDMHLRLCEIFGVSTSIPFANKTIIASRRFLPSCHLLWADQFLIPLDLLRVLVKALGKLQNC